LRRFPPLCFLLFMTTVPPFVRLSTPEIVRGTDRHQLSTLSGTFPLLLVLVLGLGGAVAAWYLSSADRARPLFRTAQVKRGDLLAAINATGTVEPEEMLDVGAQVAGQINSFGKDKNGKIIDYGSVVEAGTVLAQIDDSLYAADVAQADAQLQEARAGVKRAEADLARRKRPPGIPLDSGRKLPATDRSSRRTER
jgi:multidrug efflux pump subunit AcrA (membrane-fusion protein)